MTGCDNFLLAVEPEVSFSEGHIQNLVVTPSFLPESRQGRASFQPIGAAAANYKRTRVVLEVQTRIVQISRVKIHFGLPPLREILPESMKSFRLILQTH